MERGIRALTLPVLLASLATPARAGTAWRTTSDYPAAALREGRQGTSWFTVEVNEEGRAETCVITRSSGWKDLDDAACENIRRRARFNPATDANGKPVRSTFASKVHWVIPH